MAAASTSSVRTTRQAPGRLAGVGLVVEHYWTWYHRNWRATVVSSVLQPLLFLLAFGFGFGTLVADRAGEGVGGDYLGWLAPALLAVTAVQSAAFEGTYPVLSGFIWQRIYLGMAASPLTPAQIALGHLSWVVLKMTGTAAVFLVVVVLLGGARSPWVVLALPGAVLAGAACAALVMAYAATRESEGNAFSALFRFGVVPMILFSGTFFPIDRLPDWARWLAWVSPLWHGTELARAAGFGQWRPLALSGHVAYLGALLVVGAALLVRNFRRRLTR